MSDSADKFSQSSARKDAVAVVRRLREGGHAAYFAGGCVRDELLGLRPKDYDVATDAPPTRVRDLFSNSQAVGAAFGVILVRHGRSQVEVATFRSEGRYLDGRRPSEVQFTTAEQDAQRRDFTINGLFLDPTSGEVIDYVGGREDLAARRLRAIGDPNHRFAEDHLRVLRAVRFAARFGLEIDAPTADAIVAHGPSLKRISPERIADELRLMLPPAKSRTRAWELLWQFKLVHVILRGVPEEPAAPGTLFPNLAPGCDVDFAIALAAITLCYRRAGGNALPGLLEKSEVRRSVQACRTTLKISNEEADALGYASELGPLLRDEPPTIAQLKRFLADPRSPGAASMLEALRKTDQSVAARVGWLLEQFSSFAPESLCPPPLLTGDDLTARGLKPGKLFKRVLDNVYDAQLEGRINSKKEAMDLALRIAVQAEA